MAEAEDVISDLARHATIHARRIWQRHRQEPGGPATTHLKDVAPRLELLLEAVFGQHFLFRVAQAPARRSFLRRIFRRHDLPAPHTAVPATNDRVLWLPRAVQIGDPDVGLAHFRILALRLAMRAQRGSASIASQCTHVCERDLYTVLEAHASDAALLRRLPGTGAALHALSIRALERRPDRRLIRPQYQTLEDLLQRLLKHRHGAVTDDPLILQLSRCHEPADTLTLTRKLLAEMPGHEESKHNWGDAAIVFDDWTGLFLPPESNPDSDTRETSSDNDNPEHGPRSTRLDRRPTIRKPVKDEDDKEAGIWMIHSGAPTEHAEDPMGMQRPADRDEETPVEEFADSVSELAEARLVRTADPARDVLISDDPPETRAPESAGVIVPETPRIQYPEWDFRVLAYRDPGVTVHLMPPALGPLQWVDDTLRRHRGLLWAIRRQFETLRPRRTLQRRRPDGHDLDLDACVEALADRRAGHSMSQALYMNDAHAMRDTAVMLLIDISGSTDSWLSAEHRVIDVEREALLLVCAALESVGDPYSVQAFSGEGPHGVMVQTIKAFHERYDMQIARQIAGLEPDRYTRTGAALRHATAALMQQSSRHRLLLLLSDGKPNDADQYEGRYGVEDMRQAVNEATLQGIFPFCLTIDWQAANYLPEVFGTHQYALLPKSEHLPTIMLDWLRRLLTS